MPFIQILDCSTTLGTCCNDYGLVSVLDTFRKIMDLVQIVVPIILIIWSTSGFISLMNNPEEKNGLKKIFNKYWAATIVFFVPVLVNFVLGIMPQTFSVSACWQQAKISAEVTRTLRNTYVSTTEQTASPILINPDDFESGKEREKPSTGGGSSSSGGGNSYGSATGHSIVNYAKSFVGQRYVWGGTWNGELPYTGTDCSGFVQGVFKHHGINLTRTTYTQWADKGSYTLVSPDNIKPGDLVMYDGHVGILTGNGNQIVHAKGSNYGIVVDSDYRRCSSHAILGIMRIKGVN